MYAVVEIGGIQWKVEDDQVLRVPKIDQKSGSSVELDRVMLVVNKENVQIGQPILSDVKVKATILSHGKGKKIKVFKKKRRKRFNVLKGHRQEYTELRIDRIGLVKESKKASAAAQAKPVKDVVPASSQEKKKVAPPKKTTKKTTSNTGTKIQKTSSLKKKDSQKASVSTDVKKKSSRSSTSSQTKVTKSSDKKKKD